MLKSPVVIRAHKEDWKHLQSIQVGANNFIIFTDNETTTNIYFINYISSTKKLSIKKKLTIQAKVSSNIKLFHNNILFGASDGRYYLIGPNGQFLAKDFFGNGEIVHISEPLKNGNHAILTLLKEDVPGGDQLSLIFHLVR